jgi:hypothetical protein
VLPPAPAVDEARFALEGLCASSPLPLQRRSAADAVALAADPDTRRLLRSHKLSTPLLVRCRRRLCRHAHTAHPSPVRMSHSAGCVRTAFSRVAQRAAAALPPALALPSAALLYLLAVDRPPAADAEAVTDATARGALTRLLTHADAPAPAPSSAPPLSSADAEADSSVRCSLRRARLPLAPGEVPDAATLALLLAELGCCLPGASALALPGAASSASGAHGERSNPRGAFKAALRSSRGLDAVAARAARTAAHVAAHAAHAPSAPPAPPPPPVGPLLRCLRVLEQASFESARCATRLLRWAPPPPDAHVHATPPATSARAAPLPPPAPGLRVVESPTLPPPPLPGPAGASPKPRRSPRRGGADATPSDAPAGDANADAAAPHSAPAAASIFCDRSRSASPDLAPALNGVAAALAWLDASAAAVKPATISAAQEGLPDVSEAAEAEEDVDCGSAAAAVAASAAAAAGGIVSALVGALPALAAAAASAPRGASDGGRLGADPAAAAGKAAASALRSSLNVLTNLTNERADGAAAFAAAGGVEAAAALMPALASAALGHTHEGASENTLAASGAGPGAAADALNAALCLLTNAVEVSAAAAARLATAHVDASPQPAFAPASASASPPLPRVRFVTWLAALFSRTHAAATAGVLSSAAGGEEEEAEVTAEMIEAGEREGVALIVAAYAALLLGCVLRAQPGALGAATEALPGGKLAPLAAVLVRREGARARVRTSGADACACASPFFRVLCPSGALLHLPRGHAHADAQGARDAAGGD